MTYQAIIAPAVNVRPHPNADRVKLATVAGHQVVIGLDINESDLGVFFPCDGRLSHDHMIANKLYRKHPETGAQMGGYFEANGRVRAQKFRGEMSEGFWEPVSSLDWTGGKVEQGDLIDTLNGLLVCEKYYTPATIKAMRVGAKRERLTLDNFSQHWDCRQLRHNLGRLPLDAVMWLSLKCHGTSGRTGLVSVARPLGFFRRLLNRILPMKFAASDWTYVSGTRRVTLDPSMDYETGFYSGKTFRLDIHRMFESLRLHRGETFYYEIVGFDEDGGRIMPAHAVSDKALRKVYGDRMTYKYGCDPDDPAKSYRVLVYRVSVTGDDGHAVELSVPQLRLRCKELGLETVPYLKGPFMVDDTDTLLMLCKAQSDGHDPLDPSHVREGVVLRVEHETEIMDYKWKGDTFCELEGIAKNSDLFVDPEEAG